jgi:hypothetical protein
VAITFIVMLKNLNRMFFGKQPSYAMIDMDIDNIKEGWDS